MDSSSSSRTSETLLRMLHRNPGDAAAWQRFVKRYGAAIHGWCRGLGLQDADARDVTQEVLLKLARCMGTFVYDKDKGFRRWLKRVTVNAWKDYLKSRRRPGRGSGGSDNLPALSTVAARDDLTKRLEEEFDRELLEKALERVKERVEPQTWGAFRLTALEGMTGAEAARARHAGRARVRRQEPRHADAQGGDCDAGTAGSRVIEGTMNNTCPPLDQLRSLVDSQLDVALHGALSIHVEECTRCQGILDALTNDPCLAKVQALPPVDVQPEIAADDELMRQLESACPLGQPFQGFATQAAALAPATGPLAACPTGSHESPFGARI